ncbi:MAG: hypothetical protein IT234_07530 [Bacteroidia bacterium]|nr:hypothetical protein [Bacteroidia bacterium]
MPYEAAKELLLSRKTTILIMKNIFYIIPIFFISQRVYILFFGDFSFEFNDMFSYLSMKSIAGLIIFASIYSFSYFLETTILPNLFMFSKGKKESKSFVEANNRADKKLKEIYSENPLSLIQKSTKLIYLKEFMFIPICLGLWTISLYIMYAYILIPLIAIPLIVIVLLFYVRIVNSYSNK